MVGISEIAKGDEGEAPVPTSLSVGICLEDLHPDDQMLMFWYEQDEPPLPALYIDPLAQKRKKPNA